MPEERLERTTGIDIEDWEYPEVKRFSFKKPRNPVHFLAWDFAGQVCVIDVQCHKVGSISVGRGCRK